MVPEDALGQMSPTVALGTVVLWLRIGTGNTLFIPSVYLCFIITPYTLGVVIAGEATRN